MITGLPSFTSKERLLYTKLNLLRTALVNKFGAVTGADFKYPLVLQGDLDLNNHTLLNVGLGVGEVRFADDFATIQHAINDLPTTGGMVFLSNTTYTTGQLDLTNGGTIVNVVICGHGAASIVKASGLVNGLFKMCTKGALINLAIDLNNTASVGVDFNAKDNVLANNLYIYGGSTAATGIYWPTGSTNARVSGCSISGGGTGLTTLQGCTGVVSGNTIQTTERSLQLAASVSLKIDNNILTTTATGLNTIYFSTDSVSTPRSQIVVSNNIITSAGYNVYFVTSPYPHQIIIEGNTITGGVTGIYGSILSVAGANLRGLVINNNMISVHDDGGIKLESVTSGISSMHGTVISHNTFFDNDNATSGLDYHIEIYGTATSLAKGCSIFGNNLALGTPAEAGPIYTDSNTVNFLIAGNTAGWSTAYLLSPHINGVTHNVSSNAFSA